MNSVSVLFVHCPFTKKEPLINPVVRSRGMIQVSLEADHVQDGVVLVSCEGVVGSDWVSDRPFWLSGHVRPYWTDCPLCERKYPPCQVEVGQGEQGEEMGRVLGKPPVPDLSISPQMLDDAKGMFDPCSYAISHSVERPSRTGKAPAPVGLAMHPPGYARASFRSLRRWSA